MITRHFAFAALSVTLVAPAATFAAQPPNAGGTAHSVSQSVTRNVADAMREATVAAREAALEATRQARPVRTDQERQGPEQTEKIAKTFKVGKTGALDLNNFAGNVTVTGRAGDSIIVEAVKHVRARTPEEAKAGLDAIQVNMSEGAGRVEVRTEYTRRDIRGGVDYTVSVPVDAAVLVRTMSGDVKVSSVKGDVRADAISGNVTITGGGQGVRAKTISGDVVASDITADGDVAFSSMSGNVTARNVKAKVVEVNSTSGDLTLVGVVCGRATGSTMSGNVEFAGPLEKGGRYELRSHSGDIRLIPTNPTGFEVEASTYSGTFRSDFPVTLHAGSPTTGARPVPPTPPTPPTPPSGTTGEPKAAPPPPPPPPAPPEPPDRSGRGRAGERGGPRGPRGGGPPGSSVQGTYADGSSVLSLTSFSGNITIVKK